MTAATNQVIDTPTNNFATLSPLFHRWATTASQISGGNLELHRGSSSDYRYGGIQIPNSGKWYWEVKDMIANSASNQGVGIATVEGQSENGVFTYWAG